MTEPVEDRILRSLRRISRAIDLHSKHLAATFGLTGPQLVCLRVVGRHKQLTPSELAQEVSLSKPTVTGIVDRLVTRQLLLRERTSKDRRLVTVRLTPAGEDLVSAAPSPLQERFAQRLSSLGDDERENISAALEKIVSMMDGEDIDAAPVLEAAVVPEAPPEVAVPLEVEEPGG